MSPQVRRIAILVTSLDSAAGRQLLMAMPSGLARDVRKAMASLSAVDPQEQRQVLAEFRSQAISSAASGQASSATGAAPGKHASTLPAVASPRLGAGASAPASQAHVDMAADQLAQQAAYGADDSFSAAAGDGDRPWAQLDVASLTDLLRGERPLVIAVVLSQLQPRQAARLLEQFPREQHRAVIAHLTTLRDIDPDAMQAIDDHLASRIADYDHRRDNQNESAGRMQELLAAAAPELRNHWQEIIADSDHQLAMRLGIPAAHQSVSEKSEATTQSPSAVMPGTGSPASANLSDMLANNVVTTADAPAALGAHQNIDSGPVVLPFPAPTQLASSNVHAQPAQELAAAITALDQILELPPRTIARVLSAADGEVVLLALAGATPSFMQRFTNMLEKPDARALQARLSGLGAINLQDIDEAQRRLCELASHIVGQARSRRPVAAAARAAA